MKENMIRRYMELANPEGEYQSSECLMGYDDICIAEGMVKLVDWFADGDQGRIMDDELPKELVRMIYNYYIDYMREHNTNDIKRFQSYCQPNTWMTPDGLEIFDTFIMDHTNLMAEWMRRQRKAMKTKKRSRKAA